MDSRATQVAAYAVLSYDSDVMTVTITNAVMVRNMEDLVDRLDCALWPRMNG